MFASSWQRGANQYVETLAAKDGDSKSEQSDEDDSGDDGGGRHSMAVPSKALESSRSSYLKRVDSRSRLHSSSNAQLISSRPSQLLENAEKRTIRGMLKQ